MFDYMFHVPQRDQSFSTPLSFPKLVVPARRLMRFRFTAYQTKGCLLFVGTRSHFYFSVLAARYLGQKHVREATFWMFYSASEEPRADALLVGRIWFSNSSFVYIFLPSSICLRSHFFSPPRSPAAALMPAAAPSPLLAVVSDLYSVPVDVGLGQLLLLLSCRAARGSLSG